MLLLAMVSDMSDQSDFGVCGGIHQKMIEMLLYWW